MLHRLHQFSKTEDGAISADWMALSAGLIALAVIAVAVIGQGAQDLTDEASTTFAQAQVTLPDAAQSPD
jgi:Flp pilus assembly pilin Flp